MTTVPPPPNRPPPGGFGPPEHAGWPPLPPSRPGGGSRRRLVVVLVAVVAAAALVIGTAIALSSGDGDGEGGVTGANAPTSAEESAPPGSAPAPEDSLDYGDGDSEVDPEDLPTEELPSDGAPSQDIEDLLPTPTGGPVPSYQLRVGDCFSVAAEQEGHGERTSCTSAHDAEVVHKAELTGDFDSERQLKSRADALCTPRLESKARSQPAGTVGGTLVQYPRLSGYEAGISTVTCSLTADDGAQLHQPLR